MDTEQNPIWPWILALLIGLSAVYVASFGPACWILDQAYLPEWSHRPAWRFDELLIEASRRSHPLSPPSRWWRAVGSPSGVVMFTTRRLC